MNDKKVGVDAISPKARPLIPDSIIQLVQQRRDQMIAGTWDPFSDHEFVSNGTGLALDNLPIPAKGTVVKKAGEIGLLGVPFPREYGGLGAGEIGYCILMEELGKVDTSFTTIVGAHIGIGAMAIYLGGNQQLKEKYLPDLCSGKKLAAFALTEPQAGSDAASIKLRATREGDSYILDGEKMWITNGPIASVMSILAVTDPALGAPAVVNYASLTQDGRIMNTDQTGTVSLGEWRPVGHRQYAVTFRGQYQANDQFFSLKVCSTLTLNAAGEEFTGPFTTDIYDAGGNWVASIHGTVRATRKPIDPLK